MTPPAPAASPARTRPAKAPRFVAFALRALMSLGASGGVSGCAHRVIPNTDVDDTSENRKVIGFCERYRRAVEERDIESLVQMASPHYFETGGNAKATDDIDVDGLRAYLSTKFKLAKAIRYEIRYHRISEGENRVINVDFTYTASFQIPTAKGDVWHRSVRDNRLQVVREKDSYRILAGM